MAMEQHEDVKLGEEVLEQIKKACVGLPEPITRKVYDVCRYIRATGLERLSCERAGLSYKFWKDLLAERKELLDVVEHLMELAIEEVELQLIKAARGGRSWAVQMHLRAQRPHKYSEKQREEPPKVVINIVQRSDLDGEKQGHDG